MRSCLIFLALAALALSEASTLSDGEVNCGKAGAANEAVCEAYGASSPVCQGAKAHFEAHCQQKAGSSLSAASELKEALASMGAGDDDEAPSLKAAMAPVLRGCEDNYAEAKKTCKKQVADRYAQYKVNSKSEKSAKDARKNEALQKKTKKAGMGSAAGSSAMKVMKDSIRKKMLKKSKFLRSSSEELADSGFVLGAGSSAMSSSAMNVMKDSIRKKMMKKAKFVRTSSEELADSEFMSDFHQSRQMSDVMPLDPN